MANRIDLSNILINFLKKARYERHIKEGTLEENQFYAVTDGNEKTEYGDLFGNIENQADLYNALYASRLFKMEMCNDARGYNIVHKLYDRREFDLSKFTVVGSPTITNDGIASGFSSTNYLTQKVNIPVTTTELVIKAKFKYKKQSTNATIWAFDNSEATRLVVYSDNRILVWLRRQRYFFLNTNPLNDNDEVYIKVKVEDNHYYVNGTINNIPFSEDDVFTNGLQDMTSFRIGSKFGNEVNSSLIDLKYFSITVDGKEVFNGLKDLTQYDTYTLPSSEVITIPYIPSVDGVKIVDVAYKPLVDQLYTETGMGNYIIIDETNKTFRLPLPDIYSQIENKTSFTLRKWED